MMVNNAWVFRSSAVVALTMALVGISCDGQQGVSGPACGQGTEGCSCYPNDTCNAGLTCLSDLCVDPSSGVGGQTGTTSSGTKGGSGGANTSGLGGAIANGGATSVNGGATSVNGGATSVNGGATSVGNGGTTSVSNGGATSTGNGGATLGGTGGGSASANLIKDPRFQAFDTYWNITLNAGASGTYTHPPTAAAVCVTNTSTSSLSYYLSFSLGYPNGATDTFVIEPGATYNLSYTVSALYPSTFEVKIGHSISPYTEVYSYSSDYLTSSYKTFSHQFTSTMGDTSAGLVFNVVLDMSGQICFQQVTLSKV